MARKLKRRQPRPRRQETVPEPPTPPEKKKVKFKEARPVYDFLPKHMADYLREAHKWQPRIPFLEERERPIPFAYRHLYFGGGG